MTLEPGFSSFGCFLPAARAHIWQAHSAQRALHPLGVFIGGSGASAREKAAPAAPAKSRDV